MDTTVLLAAISFATLVVTALFKLLAANTKALNKVAESSEKVAKETAKGSREAKQRNGHLGEQNIQITKLITSQNQDMAAIRKAGEQNVATNKEALAVLRLTADNLEKNSKLASAGTKEVAQALKDSANSNQTVEQQTVVHQVVKNKGE